MSGVAKILLIQTKAVPELTLLRDELLFRGHDVAVWTPDSLSPEQLIDGTLANQFSGYDLIYYRTGLTDAGIFRWPDLLSNKTERLVNRGLLTHPFCYNKIYQSFAAIESGIKVPTTFLGGNIKFDLLVQKFGLPFIAKAPVGVRGKGVFLIDSEDAYKECVKHLGGEVLWQKFIKNDGDYRVFMIGGKLHSVYKRLPAPGNFKNNIAQGGRGEKVTDNKLLALLEHIGATIAAVLGIEVGGVDVIRGIEDDQLYFTEINVNPGWIGLDSTLGTNTAAAVADYFESRIRSSNTTSL